MTDDRRQTTPDPQEGVQGEGKTEGKNDIVETALGLAVLGLGAALVSGGFGLGGIVKTLTRGVPSGTPPIAPPVIRPPQG